jgi:hypothetical protein
MVFAGRSRQRYGGPSIVKESAMADLQLHRSTFYEMGPYTRADLWLADNPVAEQATQVIAVQVNVTTDPAARTVELKLLALISARDAINTAIARLEAVRSKLR